MKTRSLLLFAGLLPALLIGLLIVLLVACSPSASDTVPAVSTVPRYGCGYAVQKINEAQSVTQAVSWGCVNHGRIDMECLGKVASAEAAQLSDDNEKRRFSNLVWCVNLKCSNPAGVGWVNNSCAQEAFTTTCEKQLTLCFGD